MPGTHADTWYNHFKEELQDLGQVAVEVGSGPRGLTYYQQAPWTACDSEYQRQDGVLVMQPEHLD